MPRAPLLRARRRRAAARLLQTYTWLRIEDAELTPPPAVRFATPPPRIGDEPQGDAAAAAAVAETHAPADSAGGAAVQPPAERDLRISQIAFSPRPRSARRRVSDRARRPPRAPAAPAADDPQAPPATAAGEGDTAGAGPGAPESPGGGEATGGAVGGGGGGGPVSVWANLSGGLSSTGRIWSPGRKVRGPAGGPADG